MSNNGSDETQDIKLSQRVKLEIREGDPHRHPIAKLLPQLGWYSALPQLLHCPNSGAVGAEFGRLLVCQVTALH